MDVNKVLNELKEYSEDNTKKIYLTHEIEQEIYGVKIANIKKLAKKYNKNSELAKALYNTNIYEAMYLAGLIIDSKDIDEKILEDWIIKSKNYILSEFVVSSVAMVSNYKYQTLMKWLNSDIEYVKAAGYSLYSAIISEVKDEDLDLNAIEIILSDIKENIHSEKQRVRYQMNNFVISVGICIEPLSEKAIDIANEIGDIEFKMNNNSCKAPNALAYINKVIITKHALKKRKYKRC